MAIGIVRSVVERRAMRNGLGFRENADARFMALVTLNEGVWAIAPVLAWLSPHPFHLTIAFILLHVLWGVGIGQFQSEPRRALIATLPFMLVAAAFVSGLWGGASFVPALATELVWCVHITGRLLRGYRTRQALDLVEAERRQLVVDLERERDHARAGDRAKASFLTMISHELRTPMNGVLGAAQLLGERCADTLQRTYLGVITESANALLAVLNDILELTHVGAGVPIERSEFDFTELLHRVCKDWQVAANAKGLNFELEIAPQGLERLVTDPARVTQALNCLLSNAVKFTERGGVAVRVSAGPSEEMHTLVSVAVSDSGVGIAPGQINGLFEPFTQADSSVTRRFGGAGLGLAVCHKVAQLLDGRLAIESSPGAGSTFTFTFVADAPQPVKTALVETADAAPAARSLRVLIVEDHPVNRMILEHFLQAAGHATAAAEDGSIALDLLQLEQFDLVLMDVNMPVMDGLTATRRLRESAGPNTAAPVVIVSAAAHPQDRKAGFEAGADAYLNKPVDFAILADCLQDVCQGRLGDDTRSAA
ncbi:MAG TPA: response regulator [Caulobacteraceae bacterium]|nr:response regulator [Caulobacteraceae bacterium]